MDATTPIFNALSKLLNEGEISSPLPVEQSGTERQILLDILTHGPDFVGISDMQGNLKYHNSAALRMVGFPDYSDLPSRRSDRKGNSGHYSR